MKKALIYSSWDGGMKECMTRMTHFISLIHPKAFFIRPMSLKKSNSVKHLLNVALFTVVCI